MANLPPTSSPRTAPRWATKVSHRHLPHRSSSPSLTTPSLLTAVNSLALISARYTVRSIDTLQQLLSYSLYILCQALDLRALQRSIASRLEAGITSSISKFFSEWIGEADQKTLAAKVFSRFRKRLDETSARDLEARFLECYMVAGKHWLSDWRLCYITDSPPPLRTGFEIVTYFSHLPSGGGADPLRNIMSWRAESVRESLTLYRTETLSYLSAPPGTCHASPLLGKTRPIYEYVRKTLGVGMHGLDNFHEFGLKDGESAAKPVKVDSAELEFKTRATIGENVSRILAALRSGELYRVMWEGGVFK